MNEIAQIRKLSLWIFFIPLIAINLCLVISQNPEFLENTFFTVDQIGRSGFSIPYLMEVYQLVELLELFLSI
jgi:hypothetical protein